MSCFDNAKRIPKLSAAITAAVAASVLVTQTAPANALPATRHTSFRPAVTAAASLVYVADQANNLVWVFNAPAAAPAVSPSGTTSPIVVKPIRSIPTGISPVGLTVDSIGNLYVANLFDNDVQEFAPGSSTPFRTLSAGLAGPVDVKVSLSGAVYVTNLSGNPGNSNSNVVIYPPNSTTPGAAWQSPIANAALLGLALQSPDYAPGGDAYVAYGNTSGTSGGGVLWCPVGSATCFATGITTSGIIPSLAFQYNTFPLTLLASDAVNNVVDVYHLRHGNTPAATFQVAGPAGLAFDPGYNHLFVASNPSNTLATLNEYNYSGVALNAVFTPGATTTRPRLGGVAVYPSVFY
jgi:hypothetical protein